MQVNIADCEYTVESKLKERDIKYDQVIFSYIVS